MRQQAALARFTTGIDSLWHLDNRWDRMIVTRVNAAAALLQQPVGDRPTPDVDAVLDFFELIALLVKREIVDRELAWHAYYYPLVHYWTAADSESYVHDTRRQEGSTTWEGVEWLVRTLTAIEAQKRGMSVTQVIPTRDQWGAFLKREGDRL